MKDSLVCPFEKSCKIYEKYIERNRYALKKNEVSEKIIKLNNSQNYYCSILKEYSEFKKNSKLKFNGKDCALIQLLNNSEALLRLSNKKEL